MNNIKPFLVFLFFISFFSLSTLAETKVRAYTKPSVLAPQCSFTLTLEVEYKSARDIKVPRLPKLNNFYLISQSGPHHSISIINGNLTRKKLYSYILRSVKEGKFKIGSIEVIVDGKVFKTKPLLVEVSSKADPHSSRHSHPFLSPFGNMRRFMPPGFFDDEDILGNPFSKKPLKKEDILFQLEVKKETVYLGEMIIAEWFIYVSSEHSQNISTIKSQIIKHAKLNDFLKESITEPGKIPSVSPQIVDMNGKRYRKELVLSYALFPIREGTLTIDFMEISSTAIGGMYSAFGVSNPISHISNEKKIKVIPLPKDGKGSFFTEAVGDFRILAHVNKIAVPVKKPVVYKVDFKGVGHPGLIRLPDLNFGDSYEIYDTTESQKFSLSESLKSFEVILIPKKTGDFVIPSFELNSFDPNLGIYKTHILPSFKLKVVGVDLSSSAKDKSTTYFDPKKDKSAEQNLIESENKYTLTALLAWFKKFNFLKYKKIFWFSIYTLLFLLFVFILIRLFLFQRNKNTFKKRLKANIDKVEQAIKEENWKKSGIELNQLMYFFFSELSSQEKTAKNWDILLKNIKPSIRVKYEIKIKALVSRVEQLSFASLETAKRLRNKKNVENLKKEIIDLIQEISAKYTL